MGTSRSLDRGGSATTTLAAVNADIEARIAARARCFDVSALRDLLQAIGYDEGSIEYRSHQTLVHQAAVVESVRFEKQPRRRVVVTVNLGWLAAQSPLPNYFLKILNEQRDDSLTAFLNSFCHHLLRAGFLAAFPERNPVLFKDWNKSRSELRSLLGLRSLSSIHWVFSLVFPEMEVAVKRAVMERTVKTRGTVLGAWVIGDGAVCGGAATIPVSTVAVTLFCDEPHSGSQKPWATEAMRRLREQAFPTLAVQWMFLRVVLTIRDQQSFMVLSHDQHLGYEPVGQERPRDHNREHTRRKLSRSIVLWEGEVPRDAAK